MRSLTWQCSNRDFAIDSGFVLAGLVVLIVMVRLFTSIKVLQYSFQ